MKQFFPRQSWCKTLAVTFLISGSYISCKKDDLLSLDKNAGTSGQQYNKRIYFDNEHIITEEEAAEYKRRFKEKYPDMNTESYWTKRALHELLTQPNTAGTRYYFGQDEAGEQELIFISINAEKDDMIAPGKLIKAKKMSALASAKIKDWQDKQLIGLDKAAVATAKHREAHPGNTMAGNFNKEAMQLLLTHGAVFGIFSEYGLAEDLSWVIILRPLDKEGRIIPGIVIERAQLCPPRCPSKNALNS